MTVKNLAEHLKDLACDVGDDVPVYVEQTNNLILSIIDVSVEHDWETNEDKVIISAGGKV